ncbi:MAG: hypothetical protein IID45_13585, partial [Planctomycetes bacterium]|nr:hypothetical protein [Planctomycetota bacterium]
MSQTAVSYLLIATLLICPGVCLQDAAEGAPAQEADADCGCCQREHSPTDEVPGDSESADPDCLCHGAILGVADEDAALTATYLRCDAEFASALPVITGEFRHDTNH